MGAILQAFALQETLKNMGYEPEFLKLENCVIHDDGRRTTEFLEMRKHLNISSKYYNPKEDKYDAIIVGSDELWNIQEPSFEHIDEFLGYNLAAPKIIAYAPGANKTNGKICGIDCLPRISLPLTLPYALIFKLRNTTAAPFVYKPILPAVNANTSVVSINFVSPDQTVNVLPRA